MCGKISAERTPHYPTCWSVVPDSVPDIAKPAAETQYTKRCDASTITKQLLADWSFRLRRLPCIHAKIAARSPPQSRDVPNRAPEAWSDEKDKELGRAKLSQGGEGASARGGEVPPLPRPSCPRACSSPHVILGGLDEPSVWPRGRL